MTKDEIIKALRDMAKYPTVTLPRDCEALRMAADLLAQPEHGWTPERIAGMARLKDAQDKRLAQPEQEPVAWVHHLTFKNLNSFERTRYSTTLAKKQTDACCIPLYTNPPQRKPLTDEELADLYFDKFSMGELKAFARAIEAAHGIKELV